MIDEASAHEALGRLATAFASELDPQRLAQRIADEACALSGAQLALFFYRDMHTLSGQARGSVQSLPRPEGLPLFEPTLRGEVVRLDDLGAAGRGQLPLGADGTPSGPAVRSYLALPLASRAGEVQGGVFLCHAEAARFTAQHERLLLGVAAQAAIALEHTRLYAAEQRARAAAEIARSRVTRLQELTSALADTSSVEQALDLVVNGAAEAVGARAATLGMLAGPGDLRLRQTGSTESGPTVPLSSPMPLTDAARLGEVVWLASIDAARARYPHVETADESLLDRAWCALPLEVQGVRLGALEFSFGEERLATEEERSFFGSIARQCAQALERARLAEAERKARSSAEEQRRLLEAMVQQNPSAIALVEAPSGRMLFRNDRSDEIFRMRSTRPTGVDEYTQYRGRRLDGTPLGPADWPLSRSIRTGEIVVGEELFIDRGDGTQGAIRCNSAPIRDAAGNIVAGVVAFDDITAELAADAERERLLALERSARAEAEAARAESEGQGARLAEALRVRDDFLSAASHELRNPINALQLHLVSILRAVRNVSGSIPSDWVATRVGKAAQQVSRLTRLLENLLDVSRIADGKLQLELEEVELPALLTEVLDRFRAESKTAQLELLAPEGLKVRSDRMRLDQVVTNLVSNALKYGADKPIRVELHDSGPGVRLAVHDQGIGIAQEDQQRIFGRFERAVADTRRYAGFGLGLWITREIVQALGGSITVDSTPGAGSTFSVELPREPLR